MKTTKTKPESVTAVSRMGATVYLNGTRLACSHKGKPSVTGAERVYAKLTEHGEMKNAIAALVEALKPGNGTLKDEVLPAYDEARNLLANLTP